MADENAAGAAKGRGKTEVDIKEWMDNLPRGAYAGVKQAQEMGWKPGVKPADDGDKFFYDSAERLYNSHIQKMTGKGKPTKLADDYVNAQRRLIAKENEPPRAFENQNPGEPPALPAGVEQKFRDIIMDGLGVSTPKLPATDSEAGHGKPLGTPTVPQGVHKASPQK